MNEKSKKISEELVNRSNQTDKDSEPKVFGLKIGNKIVRVIAFI